MKWNKWVIGRLQLKASEFLLEQIFSQTLSDFWRWWNVNIGINTRILNHYHELFNPLIKKFVVSKSTAECGFEDKCKYECEYKRSQFIEKLKENRSKYLTKKKCHIFANKRNSMNFFRFYVSSASSTNSANILKRCFLFDFYSMSWTAKTFLFRNWLLD